MNKEWIDISSLNISSKYNDTEEIMKALAAYVGMPRAVAANSGTSSLHLAAMAAGIRRGDEVIVPTLTFIAAVNPLTRYVGAEPIFTAATIPFALTRTPWRIFVPTTAP